VRISYSALTLGKNGCALIQGVPSIGILAGILSKGWKKTGLLLGVQLPDFFLQDVGLGEFVLIAIQRSLPVAV
jgi:hypothetical protein